MDSARGLLTRYIPDVYIYTDVYKGQESGKSPGYALSLVAESTTDCLMSAECCFEPLQDNNDEKQVNELKLVNDYHFETPEDLGLYSAKLLLQYVF